MRRILLLAFLGSIFFCQGVGAQSLFGAKGLGFPIEPLDARARALGSIGVGLLGPSLNPTDLASAARIFLPSAQLTLQPQWVTGELAGQPVDNKGTRFPQIGISYPVSSASGTVVLHFSSYLDQRWEVLQESEAVLLGTSYPVTDKFLSDGGVSTVQVGWAQRLGDDLSLGFGLGTRMGNVTRTFLRTIEAGGDFTTVPFRTGGQWQYSGMTAAFSFQWDPINAVRLGGAVNWSQDLEARSVEAFEEEQLFSRSETFALPVELRFGASGILTPRLALTVGFSYADWKSSNEVLPQEALVGTIWSYGGGIEWAGPRWGVRNFPFRLGYRQSALPFTFDGKEPKENVLTGGIGLNLIPQEVGFVGGIDFGIERGRREAGALSEKFWRASMTFRVGSF